MSVESGEGVTGSEDSGGVSIFGELVEGFLPKDRSVLFSWFDALNSSVNAPGSDSSLMVERTMTDSYVRFWVDDGAGNDLNAVFLTPVAGSGEESSAGDVNLGFLVYGYDHESAHNVYGSDVEQLTFVGLPERYREIIDNGSFVWSWDESGKVYATFAVWLDDAGEFEFNEDMFAGSSDNGGLNYLLGLINSEK